MKGPVHQITRKLFPAVLTGLCFSFGGCVTLYKPNTVYSPMLTEKGEANATALLGLSGNGLYNLEASYAVTDHMAIMIDGMHHNIESGGDDSSVEKLKLFSVEAGAGYFTTRANNKSRLFQCYGGGGFGSSSDRIENLAQSVPEVNARYSNIFIQPGMAIIKEKFALAFDVRANYVHMYNINAFMYDQFEWWNTDFKYRSDTTLNFLNLEPCVTFRVGGQNAKVVFQVGAVIPAIHSDAYFSVNSSSLSGISLIKSSIGISYTFKRKQEEWTGK